MSRTSRLTIRLPRTRLPRTRLPRTRLPGMHLPRTRLPALAALLASTALVACGGGHQPTAHGDSEGAYIQAGPLIYQVQMSRELNPHNVEDREYLAGLPRGTARPTGSQEWFGVWLRVQNDGSRSQPAASDFKIVDTLGNVYQPIPLATTNAFAYQSRYVQGTNGQPLLPDPQSAAGAGVINGSMLLFKLDTSVYANRPLELEIQPPGGGEPSSVVLDL
jgi:hypothetical protein